MHLYAFSSYADGSAYVFVLLQKATPQSIEPHILSYPVFTLLDIHRNEQLELKTTTQISKTQPTLQIQPVTALYKDFVMRNASHHSLMGDTKCKLTFPDIT